MAPKRRPKNPPVPTQNQNVAWLNQQQRQQVVQAQISAIYSGPLPPPDVLVRYNDAVPGAAERILAMAERQSTHRIELESRVVNADIVRANRGLIAGFLVSILFGTGSFACILSGYSLEGLGLGGTTLLALVGTFVYGTQSKKSYLRERAKIVVPGEQ